MPSCCARILKDYREAAYSRLGFLRRERMVALRAQLIGLFAFRATLRDALAYPNPAKDFTDEAMTAALAR